MKSGMCALATPEANRTTSKSGCPIHQQKCWSIIKKFFQNGSNAGIPVIGKPWKTTPASHLNRFISYYAIG